MLSDPLFDPLNEILKVRLIVRVVSCSDGIFHVVRKQFMEFFVGKHVAFGKEILEVLRLTIALFGTLSNLSQDIREVVGMHLVEYRCQLHMPMGMYVLLQCQSLIFKLPVEHEMYCFLGYQGHEILELC